MTARLHTAVPIDSWLSHSQVKADMVRVGFTAGACNVSGIEFLLSKQPLLTLKAQHLLAKTGSYSIVL